MAGLRMQMTAERGLSVAASKPRPQAQRPIMSDGWHG